MHGQLLELMRDFKTDRSCMCCGVRHRPPAVIMPAYETMSMTDKCFKSWQALGSMENKLEHLRSVHEKVIDRRNRNRNAT